MPKILISGNGFDLNIGLPTSYINFIKILNLVKAKNKNLEFDSVYSECFQYENIRENFNQFEFNLDKIKILEKELESNIWFDFFENEYQIDTWIDFENRIEYVLNILFTALEYVQKNVFDGGSRAEDDLSFTSDIFKRNVEIIEVLSKFSIVDFDFQYNVSFNKDFLIKRYGHYSDLDMDKITRILRKELVQFKRIFNYFFEIFVFPFYENSSHQLDDKMFDQIDYHYTFNYTPTFQKLYKSNIETRFLHGRVDSTLNKIVVGINEIPTEKINKKFFLPFTKYFQKLNNDTDYIFIKELEEVQSSNFIFFFFGHSLDESDKDYINEVFDFVNKIKTEIKEIIVIHHNESSKSNLLINLLNIRGKKDIENLMRSGNLIFRSINSPELKEDLNKDIKKAYYV
ncbi:AbiH family protein [Salinimicrobium gaetbulicola]|uniref:AbiH family protein n=1 Tax=Salinimicrobium gaetbulicola TaxID=999702 RepID=A0ABW3IFG2_9FLAO